MVNTSKQLTVTEFLALPEGDENFELVDGQAVPKLAPKFLHSRTQVALVLVLEEWSGERGWVGPEWAILLKRRGRDWVPLPDITFVSHERLPGALTEDGPCPVPPELAVEVISPDQTFGELTAKATDYLAAGIDRVWIVDPRARSITIFLPDRAPLTLAGEETFDDPLLPGLALSPAALFDRARLPGR
ncbi:Uma2 family endonuclease [Gloeobacter morelensis]|uniref:Uma2 family endonuclease n=1 Tax=Gloeobacter morelensis MG652769 TaxID=2781736 RepID=A0ABY3PQN1_9CYAN|nr:Uma2 family endonuclease [Gloeobacter morelensis]UFP95949.1 Uma2 family endonuclease [Gloeobacter morelensis MG652769]